MAKVIAERIDAEKEELEATSEIVSDSSFLNSIIKGDAEFQTDQFKKWSEVKDNV
jgi:hypothetical protein